MRKKAFVLVDMQNSFIKGILGTPEARVIVENVIKAIKYFRKKGYVIIVTKDTHPKDYLTSTLEGKKLPVEHCIKDTEGWELDSRILEALGDDYIVIEKPTFGSLELVELALKEQFSELVVVGLCTDICVLSNCVLLRATLKDAIITVISNCCAGVTSEQHETALKALLPIQIDVVDSLEELVA